MAQNKAKKFVWTSCALIFIFLALSGWGRLTGQAPIAEAHAVEVDGMLLKIEALKNDVVGRLIKCESEGHSEADGIIVFDVNRVPSIGQFQFQPKTVQHYVREIEGRAITGKEAIEIALDTERAAGLAKKIIFERDGTRHWHNCATKLGLYREVKLIQKLAK